MFVPPNHSAALYKDTTLSYKDQSIKAVPVFHGPELFLVPLAQV